MIFNRLLQKLNNLKKNLIDNKFFILVSLIALIIQFFYFIFNLNFFLFFLFSTVLFYTYFSFIEKYNKYIKRTKDKFLEHNIFFYQNLFFEFNKIIKNLEDFSEVFGPLSSPCLKEFYFFKFIKDNNFKNVSFYLINS